MDVTIVIPTKNGGKLFDKVLKAVFSQKTEYEYEVICVDSGSSDETVSIIKKHPCSLYEISPEEFGHGKTRNFGASKGTGTYIVFITQDAMPASDKWLQNFIDGMRSDPEIVGGFGIHYPYPNCNVIDKRDLYYHFKNFNDIRSYIRDNTDAEIETLIINGQQWLVYRETYSDNTKGISLLTVKNDNSYEVSAGYNEESEKEIFKILNSIKIPE